MNFIPRDAKFYDLFERGAQNLRAAAAALADLVNDYTDIGRKAQRLTELEEQGDTVTHEIMAQLHRTFVTPLDREDIALLTHTLDDVVDMVEEAANTMVIYNVQSPTPVARQFAALIQQAAGEIAAAVPKLRDRGQHQRILEHCVEINRLENEGDQVLRGALGQLFNDSLPIIEVIKWRTIYEALEGAMDSAEDVANVLEGIVLKNA